MPEPLFFLGIRDKLSRTASYATFQKMAGYRRAEIVEDMEGDQPGAKSLTFNDTPDTQTCLEAGNLVFEQFCSLDSTMKPKPHVGKTPFYTFCITRGRKEGARG